MSDNVPINNAIPGGPLMATDEVAYSGDTAQVQLVRVVSVSGAEGSKTVGADLASAVGSHDEVAVDGRAGMVMLVRRRDTDAEPVVDDGDFTFLNIDEEGRLKVATKPASYPDITGDITAVQAAIGTPVVGGTVSGDVSRASNVMAFCTGTFAGVNVTFEGSLQATGDTNWFAVQAVRSNANTIETTTGVLAAQPAYAWELSVNALRRVRVRCTARTSGTQSWRFVQGTYATEPIPAAQVSATQPVSGTVTASNTAGTAAEDAAASGNPVMVGGVARTANAATTLVAGDAVRHTMTSGAALVVKQYGPMQVEFSPTLNLTTTTPAAIAAAAAAGIRNHLTAFWAINTSASAVDLIILDGATERHRYPLPPNVPVFMRFPTGLQTTAATALNANLSAAATSVRVNFTGYTSA
jgi:hypothetical protein